MRILVVEDDRKVAGFVQGGLEQEGYSVDVLHDGMSAGPHAATVDYDAVVLDLMLPGRSGLQVLRDIRARKPAMPVLILTAKDSVEARVAGLDSGADDYMPKPFALAELSARLRALLRRGSPKETRLRVADLEMDTARRSVNRAGKSMDLKPKEYSLLEFLMRNSDRPVTRSLIIEHVWDIHFDSVSNVSKSPHQFPQGIDVDFYDLLTLSKWMSHTCSMMSDRVTGRSLFRIRNSSSDIPWVSGRWTCPRGSPSGGPCPFQGRPRETASPWRPAS